MITRQSATVACASIAVWLWRRGPSRLGNSLQIGDMSFDMKKTVGILRIFGQYIDGFRSPDSVRRCAELCYRRIAISIP